MAGCIKDEAPNAEADILDISFEDNILSRNTIQYNPAYDATLGAYPLEVTVKLGTDLSSLSPIFTLTDGATISPASGSTQDFSQGRVVYEVTSQDGKWVKTYSINIMEQAVEDIPLVYHFEEANSVIGLLASSDPYQVLIDRDDELDLELEWASGNPGYNWAKTTAATDDYPTCLYDDGYVGKCAKLTTKDTGSLGKMAGMPIAAGNLFMGSFDMTNAVKAPLESTIFGINFCYKPLSVSGYFKYTAGDEYYEDGQYTDTQDMMSIYALFYEGASTYDSAGNPLDDFSLDGNIGDYDYEDDHMVALAIYDNPHETDEWTYFEMEFDYDRYGKSIDGTKLANGVYKISLVFAASDQGGHFKGAPGSTLLVDEVTLTIEE